jgi:hypothetical protein
VDQDKLHSDIISVRNTEANLGWIRNGFYSAFNSAIFGLLVNKLHPGQLRYAALCLGGITLSVFWFVVAVRSRDWMTYWHECLGELESTGENVMHMRAFAGKKFETIDTKRIRSHAILKALIILVGNVWYIMFLYSLNFTNWDEIKNRLTQLWRILP